MKITTQIKPTKKNLKDYDPAAMRVGKEIEKEHTTNPKLQKMIAAHHIDEFADYYDKNIGLPAMEKRLEGIEKRDFVKKKAMYDALFRS